MLSIRPKLDPLHKLQPNSISIMMKTITLELGTRPDAEKLENPKKFEYIGFIKLSICIIIYTFFKLQIQVFIEQP